MAHSGLAGKYDKKQLKLAKRLVKIGKKQGASRKQIISAIATGLVETNLKNLGPGYDLDSEGWRGERRMYYDNPRNVKASATRYYQETADILRGNPNISMGDLAQAAQRSAYPERYAQHKEEALGVLSQLGKINGAVTGSQKASKGKKEQAGGTGSGMSKQDLHAAQLAFVRNPDKTVEDYAGIHSARQSATQPQQAQEPKVQNKKKGKKEQGSGKLGTKGNVDVIGIAKMAQQMGLHVGEHPKFGGVAPVHTTNSFHYSSRAIDVSGDPALMRKFANRVAKRYGKKVAELFWRGPGWVNIDNGTPVDYDFVSGHESHVHVAI